MSPSGRLLTLLSLLQARRDWPGLELADRLGCSPRTVRRDVERLRELGYPVESLTGPAGGYRLAAGTAMPPLLLDDEEAVAIAVGLRTAARSAVKGIEETSVRALVKLEQVLPAHLRRRVQAIGDALATPVGGGPVVDPECLMAIAAAQRDGERVRFSYVDKAGEGTQRDVEPHGLVHLAPRWYVVAWDVGRGAWRTFRLDRVERPRPTGVRFKARKLPGGDPAAYVRKSIRSATFKHEAEVLLHAPASHFEGRGPWLWGALEPRGEDRCVLRTGDDDVRWLALRIAGLGVDFEVDGPPELLDELRVLGERAARAAG